MMICKSRKIVFSAFLLMLGGMGFSIFDTVAQGLPEIQNKGGIAYVSGGVGEEERAWLDELSGRFNLKVTMALQEGSYLSNIRLRIYDQNGQLLLNTVANGPWFFADLPAGAYTIDAEGLGRSITKTVKLGATVQSKVLFAW